MGIFQTPGSNSHYGVFAAGRQSTFAATGADQATAATLKNVLNIVSGATGTNGVILPKAKVLGRNMMIYSSAATNALLIYPPVGGTINNGALNTAFSATARVPFQVISVSADGLNWILK